MTDLGDKIIAETQRLIGDNEQSDSPYEPVVKKLTEYTDRLSDVPAFRHLMNQLVS